MRRRRLFWKYTTFFVLLVTAELLASGITELYFSYQENQAALVALQREKAVAAASQIEGFVKGIEQQMGWVTQPQRSPAGTTLEQRRFDFFRLQRQVPAITEVSYVDAAGREQLRVSRLAMDAIGSQADLSADPRFVEAKARKVYRGPVYFRKESEPYMVIAIAEGGQSGGVTAAEVNLKFIWDVVSQIKIGKAGQAFVVDGQGALIAHPDISLVLQKTDLTRLDQVKAALAGRPHPDSLTRLDGVRGAAARGGLRAAPRLGEADGAAPVPGHPALGGGEPHAGPLPRAADPGAAGRRGAHRGRQPHRPQRGEDRRRAGVAGRPVQPDGGAAAGIVRGTRAKGRGPHRGAAGGARAADRDRGDPGGHQRLAERPGAGVRGHPCQQHAALRGADRHAVPRRRGGLPARDLPGRGPRVRGLP